MYSRNPSPRTVIARRRHLAMVDACHREALEIEAENKKRLSVLTATLEAGAQAKIAEWDAHDAQVDAEMAALWEKDEEEALALLGAVLGARVVSL